MKRLCYLVLILLVTGCSTKQSPVFNRINCPGYSNTFFAAWFPYAVGDIHYFSDTAGNTDTLIIDEVSYTVPYTINDKIGDNVQDVCSSEGFIGTKKEPKVPGKVRLLIIHYEEGPNGKDEGIIGLNSYSIKYKVSNNEISAIEQFNTNGTQYSYEKLTTTKLNGKTYNDVFIVTTIDPTAAAGQGIDKFYFAKGQGVAGYRTYPAGAEYWKQ